MKPSFRMLLTAAALAVALGGPARADETAKGRPLTLTFPTRTIEATIDVSAMERLVADFSPGADKLAEGEARRFRKAVGTVESLLTSGRPVLVAVEYRRGDPAGRDLAYGRARSLRALLMGGLSSLPSDRLVIAALAGDTASGRGTGIVFAPLALGGDLGGTGGDPVRAVALDSAYIGPVYADIADAAVASAAPIASRPPVQEIAPTPSQSGSMEVVETAPAPAAPAAPERSAGKPDPVAQSVQGAPSPSVPSAPQAGAQGEAEGRDVAAPADGGTDAAATETLRYTVMWCPRPARILDDFYPGGPIVPCSRPRS